MDFVQKLSYYGHESLYSFLGPSWGTDRYNFYQISQVLTNHLWVKLMGLHYFPWFLLFTFSHAFVALLAFRFLDRFCSTMGWREGRYVAWASVLLVLVAPVNAEVQMWRACWHYFYSIGILLAILNLTLDYIGKGGRKRLLAIGLLYLLSTPTVEHFYLTPIYVLLLVAVLWRSGRIPGKTALVVAARIEVPLLLIWTLYYMVHHAVYATWVAHYPVRLEEVFAIPQVLTHWGKYALHQWGMEYFWPSDYKYKAYAFLESNGARALVATVLIVSFLIGGLFYKRLRPAAQVALFFLAACLVATLLMLPLGFTDFFYYLNDRYYLLLGIFAFPLLCTCGYMLFRPRARAWAYGAYVMVSLSGTLYLAAIMKQAAAYQDRLLDGFSWEAADTVYFLDLPNHFKGVGMIPASDPSQMALYLSVLRHKEIAGKAYDVTSFNVEGAGDGVFVRVLDERTLQVRLAQGGNWWWYGNFGASAYENEAYRFEPSDDGSYKLTFKEVPSSRAAILFQSGGHWKVVDMRQREQEQ